MNWLDSSGDSKVWMKEVVFCGSGKGRFIFMIDLKILRMVIAICLMTIGIFYCVGSQLKHRIKIDGKFIARTAVFAAMSIILYIVPVLKIKLPFLFPEFLEFHLDEIPTFIAGFAYGPLSVIIILIIKTLVKLPVTTTLGVGELIDLLYSIAFVLPAVLVYKKKRNFKGAIIGISIGLIAQLIVSCLCTTFVMLDFYCFVYGMPKQVILNMCQKINPAVTSLEIPFMFMVCLPFNAMKDGIVIVGTLALYKGLHRVIDKIGAQKN